MKAALLILSIIGISFVGLSQQEAQFTQYYSNPYLFNPGAGGLSKTINADLGFRRQWMGIEGSPQSFYATIHSEIDFDKRNKTLDQFNSEGNFIYATPQNSVGANKHVVGAKIFNDQIGPFMESSVMLNYAFHLRFTEKTMLSFGVSAGYAHFGINKDKVKLKDSDDARYDEFLVNSANQSRFDMDAGMVFYGEKFQLGVSSTQLVGNKLVLGDITTESRYGRHWFIYGMYDISLKSSPLSFEPHFMMQMIKGAPFSLDMGVRMHIEKKYWFDVSYRLQDAVSIGAGLNLGKNLRLGYAYDIALGKVQRMNNYVHEIVLGFTFGSNRVVTDEIIDDIE